MEYQIVPHSSLGLPCGLYQFMSLTEGTALLFESKWVLYPAFDSPPTPSPPTCPPPIESIRDITGAEKNYQKTSSIQVASRNSYKMLATYITTLLIQYIWRD